MPSKRRPPAAEPPPHTVLLAVLGMSPAVLTETVWALAHPPRGGKALVPDEVIVVTTVAGAARIASELLEPSPVHDGESVWQALRAALARKSPRSSPALILHEPRILSRPDARTGRALPLEDIRTPADNEAAADFILEQVRGIVARPDTRLVATLAGGRKTMGALLYAAMNLLARETDLLTHVLVNEPFENPKLAPQFHFPVVPSIAHRLGEKTFHSTDARIELASVPFVPLRNRFRDLPETAGVGGFMRMTREYSAALRADGVRPVKVELPRSGRTLFIGRKPVEMENPHQIALLRWLAESQGESWLDSDFKTVGEMFRAAYGFEPEAGKMDRAYLETARKIFRGAVPGDAHEWIVGVDIDRFLTRTLNELRRREKRTDAAWAPPPKSLRFRSFTLVS